MKKFSALLALIASSQLLTHEVCAQGSLTPPGPPEATMRSLDQIEPRKPISTLPFVISQPGAYYLTQNLTGTTEGITVLAPGVTLDLGGYELAGDRFVFGHGLVVVPSDKVAVSNGRIRGWGGSGVYAPGCSNVVLSALHVTACAGDGIVLGSGSVRDTTVCDNAGAGVRAGSGMGSGKVSMQDISICRITGNGGGAITYVGPCDASVSDSFVCDNTGSGIRWIKSGADDSFRLALHRCSVDRNTGRGLDIEDPDPVRVACTTRGTSFRDNGGDGITVLLSHADAGLQLDLREGVSSGNGGCGMNVQEGGCADNRNVIVDFQFSRNALHGAAKYDLAAAPGLFSRVVARHNGGRGFDLQGGSWTLEQCLAADNMSDGVHAVMRTCCRGHVIIMKIDDCELARNDGSGLHVEPDAGGNAYKVDLRRVSVTRNSAGGVWFGGTCDLSAADTSLSGNTGRGLAWASLGGGGGGAGVPGANPSFRLSAQRLACDDNTDSGLHIFEPGAVDVRCLLEDCTFDRNGVDGMTLLLGHDDARLDITHRGGGACDNVGHGLNLAAGRAANQGFFDITVSRNGGSGCNKIDAGPSPGVMENVVAQGNALHGLDLTGGTWSLSRCVASDNTGSGVTLKSKFVRTGHVTLMKFDDCDAERNGLHGLHVATAEADADYKLVCDTTNLRANGGDGLHVSCDHASSSVELDWRDCSASGNTVNGVVLIAPVAMDKGLRFRVTGGDCSDNGQDGFAVDDTIEVGASILSTLTLSENGECGFVSPSGPLRFSRCVAADNALDGFRIVKSPLSSVTDWGGTDCDDTDALRNGGAGIVFAGFDASSTTAISIRGGQVCDNAASGIDLETSPGARGRVHRVHMGVNLAHGLISAASSLSVTDCQATGNAGSGLHVLSGAHVIARNVCTDNAVGVYLATTGSTVLQNTFGGGSGGVPQVPVDDISGASDVAPSQSAASGTNPLGNLVF